MKHYSSVMERSVKQGTVILLLNGFLYSAHYVWQKQFNSLKKGALFTTLHYSLWLLGFGYPQVLVISMDNME